MKKLTITRKISPVYMLGIDYYTFDIIDPTFNKSKKSPASFLHPFLPTIIPKNLL
jgi:hypothetical protein